MFSVPHPPSAALSPVLHPPTFPVRKVDSKGFRSKTKRAGIEGSGSTCSNAREQIGASNPNMSVLVGAVGAAVVVGVGV
eukprot:6454844-Pyramimonas_sp.AAC.1